MGHGGVVMDTGTAVTRLPVAAYTSFLDAFIAQTTNLTLPASNFLIPMDDVGTFCFAFAPTSSGLSLIGNIQQEGIQILFDSANGLMGFGLNVIQVVDPEIQVMDEVVDDPDVEENLVAVEEMVRIIARIVAPAEKEAGTVATAIKQEARNTAMEQLTTAS
ncbi:protein aspartic protease in guard cell 2 [Tanacetum coccineum]